MRKKKGMNIIFEFIFASIFNFRLINQIPFLADASLMGKLNWKSFLVTQKLPEETRNLLHLYALLRQ